MNNKRIMIILIILMVIGFAAITASLVFSGVINVRYDDEDFNESIIFTKATIDGVTATIDNPTSDSNDGIFVSIGNKGKSLTFTTKVLDILGDNDDLDFEITNYSKQYDGITTISCKLINTGSNTELTQDNNGSFKLNDYIKVTPDKTSYTVPASDQLLGTITSTLIKSYIEEDELSLQIECTLNVNAKAIGRRELPDKTLPERP